MQNNYYYFFTVNNQLVYMILGADYDRYVVGYNCKHGVTKRMNKNKILLKIQTFFYQFLYFTAEVVIQTRNSYPTLDILEEAYNIVMNNGLPMKYLVCANGF